MFEVRSAIRNGNRTKITYGLQRQVNIGATLGNLQAACEIVSRIVTKTEKTVGTSTVNDFHKFLGKGLNLRVFEVDFLGGVGAGFEFKLIRANTLLGHLPSGGRDDQALI